MSRRRWLWALGAATLALFVVLALLDTRMTDEGGPGIVGFEFAASEDRAEEILADWGEEGRDAARLSLWLDFAYLALYGSFLTLAVAAIRDGAAARGRSRLVRTGAVIVAFPVTAAACDAAEDVLLLLVLGDEGGAAAPPLAAGLAGLKFALAGVAILYLLAGLISLRVPRRSSSG